MARREKIFLPSLLDRLVDAEADLKALEALQHRLKSLERRLSETGDRQERAALLDERRETLARLELLGSLARTWSGIRQCVRRDLEWLFNAKAFSPPERLEGHPEVQRSVINFGLPDLTGRVASEIEPREIEQLFYEAIVRFEPRILRRSLKVRVSPSEGENALMLEIEGELWTEPLPLHLRLRSRVDLEEGKVDLVEFVA